MTPKLSIIIPVYNAEMYLGECLDSLLNQTFKNIEIIIINDCSPDDSESIILEYMSKDPRIKYIKHEKNRSVLQARISGILTATGDYIWCVDPDDYIPTLDAFQILVDKIDCTQAEVIQFKIDSTIELNDWFEISVLNLLSNGHEVKQFFFTTDMKAFDLANRIVKRGLFNKIIKNIPRDSYMNSAEDFFMCSLIMNSADSYIGIDEFLYFYRQNENSLTNTALTKDLALSYIKNFQQILDILSLSLSVENIYVVQKELGLQSFIRIVKSLDKVSPEDLNELLALFTIITGDNYSKKMFLWCVSDILIFDKNLIKNNSDYLNNIKKLLTTLNFSAAELEPYTILSYIYTAKQPNNNLIIFLFRLQLLQKIKKIIIIILKKTNLYDTLKKLYKTIRK